MAYSSWEFVADSGYQERKASLITEAGVGSRRNERQESSPSAALQIAACLGVVSHKG